MNVHPIIIPRELDEIRCRECRRWFGELVVITTIGGPPLELCGACCGALRRSLTKRRRLLNPRVRRALEMLDASPSGAVSELALREWIGRYATNTLKSLRAKGFAATAVIGQREVLTILPRGREALERRALESVA